MSIRFRFTITLTLLGLLLFGGYGLVDYYRERSDLRASIAAEIQMLGRSLQISLANALRDRQRVDIDETLRTLAGLPTSVDIYVREPDGATIRSRDAETSEQLDALLAQVEPTRPERLSFADGTATYLAPLLGDHDELLGAIAVVRHTTDLADDLTRTKWRLIILVLGFVAITSLVGMLLGTIYVTRPARAVLTGIRHVREGDFRRRVPGDHRDELGALVAEFNAMVGDLEDARDRAQLATDAHLRLESGLQRVDKMITIGQLSAGLAHEIGSPLQVLRGRASALLEATKDPEVLRQARILIEQTERISRIVEQLLSFGRRRPTALTRCVLAEPINTVIELLGVEARRQGVTLTTRISLDDATIEADADQMQQVVLNLVRNALAVTPRGGTITVSLEPTADAEAVRLVVADTGPGISAEMRGRMFEPFFTTRASEGGTGLGLAVVRAIVVEHGGKVAVDSEPGQGARFTVTLPRRPHPGRSLHA